MKREEENEGSKDESGEPSGWLPYKSYTLGAIAIGLTAFVIVSRYSLQNKFIHSIPTFGSRQPPAPSNPTTQSDGPTTTPLEEKRPSKIPIPKRRVGLKVGME